MRIAGTRLPGIYGVFWSSKLTAHVVAPAASRSIPPPQKVSLASARSGILKHGEHLVDLVLDIVPGSETREYPAFEQFAAFIDRFIEQVKQKEIGLLNEKFDGSPSLVLGFDATNRPYVAYKHGIGRKGEPRIVRNIKEARRIFKDSAMGEILEDCLRHLRPRLLKFKNKDLVFQADLLFTPRGGTKNVADHGVSIRANPFGIEYTLPLGSKFYEFAAQAKVGLVVHTVGRRVVDEATDTITGAEPIEDVDLVEGFVKTLRSEDIFVIDPWSRRVHIDQGESSFSVEKEQEILRILHDMRVSLSTLGEDFRASWKKFLPHFKIFLNAGLKEGKSGGIYKAAAMNKHFDFDRIVDAFRSWITLRASQLRISPSGAKRWMAPKKIPDELEALLKKHGAELYIYLKAYFDANRIQYLLRPHMEEVYSSKLGGGRVEGIMVTDDATQVKVKLVDRLDFTMQNFAGETQRKLRKRTIRKTKKASAPKLFRRWHAGAAFFIGKLQPPHAGHVALLGAAIEEFGVDNLFILASNKAPRLDANDWRDLGVASRKKDLAAGLYTHVFSPELREEILRHGLAEGVNVNFVDTSTFWRYLSRAKEKNRRGQVALIMGKKEMEQGRYGQQFKRFGDCLRAVPIEMQRNGLSATEVRQAIRNLHQRGDIGSYELLSRAFEFVPAKERDRIIGRLIKEWGIVEAAVTRLIGT